MVRASCRSDTGPNVTLACSDVFGSMWLLPWMSDFWRGYPEVKVDHLISDNTRDFRRTEVDLWIRFGPAAGPTGRRNSGSTTAFIQYATLPMKRCIQA